MSEVNPRPENPNPDYQDRDIRLKSLVVFLVVMSAVCGGTMIAMLHYLRAETVKWQEGWGESAEIIRSLPDGLRLQVDEKADLIEHRAYEQQELNATEWVDKEAGVARIPIEEAMAAVAEEGWDNGLLKAPEPEKTPVPAQEPQPQSEVK